MIQALSDFFINSFVDITQNPVSVTIFIILALLVVSLLLAMVFNSWREILVNLKFLEEDEHPKSLLIWVIGVIVIVKITQTFLIQPFIVDGGSMLNTFHSKDFLIVDKLSYRLHEAHRGDVMIFRLYEGGQNQYTGKYLIKRVIGLPGERVFIKDGITTIYNKENPDGFVLDESYVTFKDATKNVNRTLSDHEYFVMGDNRAESYDSRSWGALEDKYVQGQVLFRILPFSDFGYEAGKIKYDK